MPTPDGVAQEQSGLTVGEVLQAAVTFVSRAVAGADVVELARSCPGTSDDADGFLPIFCRLAACDPQLLERPPAEALRAQLRMFVALTSVAEASLWTTGGDARLECLTAVGTDKPARSVRDAARRTLTDPSTPGGSARTVAIPVLLSGRTVAALVARVNESQRDRATQAGREIAAAVAPVLARATLLADAGDRDRILSEAANRRLARLGFDIHDGPLQDVVALLADARLYRRQLTRELPAGEANKPLVDRIDDFEARLLALVDELRELAELFEPVSILSSDLGDVLRREVETFRRRGDVNVQLVIDLDADSLTASQRITIIRVIQEALANVRDYSEAQNVSVKAVQVSGSVVVEVTDDGKGFDVVPALARARRQRRLGLAGMTERVRLLGGEFELASTLGAGTTISVVLPAWSPGTAA